MSKHVDSQWRCLVMHYDGYGQCLKCSVCLQFIRPQDWDSECPGPPSVENIKTEGATT
jgi:hypothetical protein